MARCGHSNRPSDWAFGDFRYRSCHCFASLREIVGEEEIEMDASGWTVAELKESIRLKYGADQVKDSMMAINEEFALDDTKIENEDIIAFIPPVSGG